ncbi:MAG: hypothetical protein WKF77_31730, partial [Planctomycetaceae bacterium]
HRQSRQHTKTRWPRRMKIVSGKQSLHRLQCELKDAKRRQDFTSVRERIVDRQSATEVATPEAQDQQVEHGEHAGWLAPVALVPPRKKVREKEPTRRASNKGCLPMTLDQYLKLLDWTGLDWTGLDWTGLDWTGLDWTGLTDWTDWTGRQCRKDKAGRIPVEFDSILERLDCSAESWLDLVQNFRKRFRTEAGLAKSLQSVSSARRSRRHASFSA